MASEKTTNVLGFVAKERSTNFSFKENEKLKELVNKYKDVLFCKKTDGISSKQKEKTWHMIEKEFNAVGEIPRSLKQLKYKFDNMKRAVKKEASKERQKMIKTGGGRLTPSPPPSPGHDTSKDWLQCIMSTSINGHEAIYDDDVIVKPPQASSSSQSQKEPEIVYKVILEEDSVVSSPLEKIAESPKNIIQDFDISTPYTSLKRPMASPLKRLAKKKKAENPDIFKMELHTKKLSVMDNLQDLELEKIRKSIAHDEELHQQRIRHSEEKHKLELIKLQLEIENLKHSS